MPILRSETELVGCDPQSAKPRTCPRRAADCSALSRPRPVATATTWLDAFVAYAAGECHLAVNTVAAYRRDLAHFFLWLQQRSIPSLTIRDLADYVGWLHAPRVGPGQHRSAHRVVEGLLSLPAIGRRAARKSGGTAGQPEALGARAQGAQPRADRPALCFAGRSDPVLAPRPGVLELLYATGCRASELSHLRLRDMHLDEGFCVCRGKGDKERSCRSAARAIAAVRAYLEHERPQRALGRERPWTGFCYPIEGEGCGESGCGNS